MQNDILFDNIYIGHSEADADALKQETFDLKLPVEKEEEEASKPKVDDSKKDPKSPMGLNFMDDPLFYVKEKSQLFFEIAKRDPMEAVRFVPEVAAGLALGAITLLLVVGGLLGGGGAAAAKAPSKEQMSAKAQQAQDQAAKVKDQVVAAVASGTDTVKDEVNKRSTRSSAGQ